MRPVVDVDDNFFDYTIKTVTVEQKVRPKSVIGKERPKKNLAFGGSKPRNCLITFDTFLMNIEKNKYE